MNNCYMHMNALLHITPNIFDLSHNIVIKIIAMVLICHSVISLALYEQLIFCAKNETNNKTHNAHLTLSSKGI